MPSPRHYPDESGQYKLLAALSLRSLDLVKVIMFALSAVFVAALFSATAIGAPINLQRRALPITITASTAKTYLNACTLHQIDYRVLVLTKSVFSDRRRNLKLSSLC